MTDMQATGGTSKRTRRTLLGLAVALVLAVGVLAVWTTVCPCDRTPGFLLLGAVEEKPIADWRFANDVPLCQIQIWTTRGPHALNLNCMATGDGQLYLSCSAGATKFWCPQVGHEKPGHLRLNGVVYPVVLTRVLDPAELDRAWDARIRKLQVHGGGPVNPVPPEEAKRPESWWSFRVRSAGVT